MSVVLFTDRDLGRQFPSILKAAGISVESHHDHFAPDTSDEEWLTFVGERNWIAVTHDKRIRYKPNELAVVVAHRVGLLVIVGHAPFPELARSFVATRSRIESFIANHTPPYIAKVYRPTPGEYVRRPGAPGRIELSYLGK